MTMAAANNGRRICDSYYHALGPHEFDDANMRKALAAIPLPPHPGAKWFWQRVSEEFATWEPVDEGGHDEDGGD